MIETQTADTDALAEDIARLAVAHAKPISSEAVSRLLADISSRALALSRGAYVVVMSSARDSTQRRLGVTDEDFMKGEISSLLVPFQNLVVIFSTLNEARKAS